MSRHGKVIVAMSGGVDSSVAGALLKEQGYECVGVFMRVGVPHEPGAQATGRGQTPQSTTPRPHEQPGVRDQALGSRDWGPGIGEGATPHSSPPSSPQPLAPMPDPTFPRSPVPTPPRRLKHGCCSVEDALDARAIAGRLGIPFYVLNFQADFDRIIEYFVEEYTRARTPNPCVLCNTQLKFGKLLRYANALDAEYVATGHYARIVREEAGTRGSGNVGTGNREQGTGNGEQGIERPRLPDTGPRTPDPGPRFPAPGPPTPVPSAPRPLDPSAPFPCFLARARNLAKDQSYVLFGIRRDDLPRCLFPLGEIADKADVRRTAADLGLKVHDKPESQEICFVPDGDYKRLVRDRRPEALRAGEIRDATGNVLGTHEGVANFTIGQRRGLRLAAGHPIYVTRLDAASNTVTIGPREELLAGGLVATQVNWLVDLPPADPWWRAEVKIRHQHMPVPGRIRTLDDGSVEARFDAPQPAVTPGQAAVFYGDGGIVLAGGWITRALPV